MRGFLGAPSEEVRLIAAGDEIDREVLGSSARLLVVAGSGYRLLRSQMVCSLLSSFESVDGIRYLL